MARFRHTQVKAKALGKGELSEEWRLMAEPKIAHRVFVPGYKGSHLVDADGRRVFLTFWQGLGLSTPSLLWPSALRADGPVAKVGTTVVYQPWLDALSQHGGYSVFSYDWRQSNLETAKALVAHLRELPQPVEVIGHSLGGLLALVAAQEVPVARVTIVGAPVGGGTGFLRDLVSGVPVGMNRSLISPKVAASFDSVWSFFPLDGRIDGSAVDFYAPTFWQSIGLNVSAERLTQARRFRERVERPQDRVRVVYSRAHLTEVDAERTGASVRFDTRPLAPGDGRVHAESALPSRYETMFESTYEHSELLNDPGVQDWIFGT